MYKTYKELRKPERKERTPSIRKVRALEIYVGGNGRKSKAQALREAGYSPSVVDHPDKVFTGRSIERLMAEMGMSEKTGLEILERNADAKIPVHYTFPPFNSKKAETPEEEAEELIAEAQDEENMGEKFGEQMTDDQIREYMELAGCRVTRIVHGERARHVYCMMNNSKAQLETAKMIFDLIGSFAPKKVESKNDHRVGIFSMKQLRQEMEKAHIEVTDPLLLDNFNDHGEQ